MPSKKIFKLLFAVFCLIFSSSVLAEQRVTATLGGISNKTYQVLFKYDADKKNLTGLGLTFYFNSRRLSWAGYGSVFKDTFSQDATPVKDTANGDGDAATDYKLTIAWLSFAGKWPGSEQTFPLDLLVSKFKLASGYKPAPTDTTTITMTASSAAGETFKGTNLTLKLGIVDTDSDGIPDNVDNCPTVPNPRQLDFDKDKIGDLCDPDDDNDGVNDDKDKFPKNPKEWEDTDNDGIGNNADLDDDNDGMPDVWEKKYSFNPLDPKDAKQDADGDGFDNLTEFKGGTNPRDKNSTPKIQKVVLQGDVKTPINREVILSAMYSVSTGDKTLTGLGLRIHFDSKMVKWNGFKSMLSDDLLGQDRQPVPDTEDFDKLAKTDVYINVAWGDLNGKWPNKPLPTKLYDVEFKFLDNAGLKVGDKTTIAFSSSDTAVGATFGTESFTLTVAHPFNWDIDGNKSARPLSDGLLNMRYLFGFRGATLVADAIDTGATRTTPASIEKYIKDSLDIVDIDGNGKSEALSDGLLLIRYLFGFRGKDLIIDAVSKNAKRLTAVQIETYIKDWLPPKSK